MENIRAYVRKLLLESGKSGKKLTLPNQMPSDVPMINFSDRVHVGTRAENLVRIMAGLPLVLRHAPSGEGADVPEIGGGLQRVISNPRRGVEVKSVSTFSTRRCTIAIELTMTAARRILGRRIPTNRRHLDRLIRQRGGERLLQDFAVDYFNRRTVLAFNRDSDDPRFWVLGGAEAWEREDLAVSNRRNRRTPSEIFEAALGGERPLINVQFNPSRTRSKMRLMAGDDSILTPTNAIENIYGCILKGISPRWVIENMREIERGNERVLFPNPSRGRRTNR